LDTISNYREEDDLRVRDLKSFNIVLDK